MKDPYAVPAEMRERYEAVSALTDAFCREHLTEEYADMCRQMMAKLARKRPSPIASGRPQHWAAGAVHAVATVNFAFDRSQDAHITTPEISAFFGVGRDAPAAKSKVIRDLFHIDFMDPKWTIPSRMDDNPMAWYIAVNGFVMDARNAPLEVQIIAYEKGLIPYVPGSRE